MVRLTISLLQVMQVTDNVSTDVIDNHAFNDELKVDVDIMLTSTDIFASGFKRSVFCFLAL